MKRLFRGLKSAVYRLVLCLLLFSVGFLCYQDIAGYLSFERGRVRTFSVDLAELNVPRFGTNVALEQYQSEQALHEALLQVQAAGLGVVRQRFSWADIEPQQGEFLWERWDRILPIVSQYGLQVIATLDTSPVWARSAWEFDNSWAPPIKYDDYAQFVTAFAARYDHYIKAYQIWDQPNISPHWGSGEVSPKEYVDLLRAASTAIRENYPNALIIAGGMAPTIEESGKNLSDVQFLREISRRGASQYYDILGIRAMGFWSGADDRQTSEDRLNFSRAILLREEMVRRGDGAKAIWALDSGWCALPTGWQGMLSPSGNDGEQVQTARLQQAVQRVQHEWPWLGLMCLQQLQPIADHTDPVWGYALLDPDGRPRLVYQRLQQQLGTQQTVYPGYTSDLASYVVTTPSNGYMITFWGTELEIIIDSGKDTATFGIQVDGSMVSIVPLSESGLSQHLLIASGLAASRHTMYVYGSQEQLQTIEALNVRARGDPLAIVYQSVIALVALLYLLILLVKSLSNVPWRQLWTMVLQTLDSLPPWLTMALLAVLFTVSVVLPISGLRMLAFGLYGLLALARPRQSFWVAVFCIPLAPLQIHLGPGSFSLAEASLLVAVGARLWQILLNSGCRCRMRFIEIIRQINMADIAVLLVFLLSVSTSFWAEYQRVAWREFRVVILDSVLFYFLIRTLVWDERSLTMFQSILLTAAFGVACYALLAYWAPSGVVAVEGVRRARAFFGSPNNLALYLERVLPIALAVGFSRAKLHRWLYLMAGVVIVTTIILTYSRGAIFLGLPAIVLTLVWMRGGRWRWLALIGIIAGIALVIPLLGTERFASLLDPTRGTSFIRLGLWRASLLMVRDHTLLGVGLDNFLYYYGDYILPGAEVERFLSHPHNLVLDFWLRLGVGGLVALLMLLWAAVRSASRAMRRIHVSRLRMMVMASVAGIAAMVCHGLVDSSFFVVELAYWFMLTLAWLGCAQRLPTQLPSLTAPPTPSILPDERKVE
ncbi:MAG: O-antigen ligase family protein [Anaerolineae bacterium]